MSDLNEKIIPFELTAQQASAVFARYIARNKLSPTEVFEAARQGQVTPVYFPAYAFECPVTTRLTADCTVQNGDTADKFTAHREMESKFSNIVIPAADKVDATLFSLLEPYDLQSLAERTPALTADIKIQDASASAEEIFERIEPDLRQQAFYNAHNTISGYTDKEVTENDFDFSRVTATRILLPMWVLDCKYKGQTCRLFMNGQTGKIAGVPPRSTNKIIAFLGAGAAVGAVLGQFIWMAVKALW